MMNFCEISRLMLAVVVTTCILSQSKCSSAAYISRSGGYDLVIALDESVPPPTTIPNFLNSVEKLFTSFSNQLWSSTRNKFHVNSVDLLIPRSWSVLDYSIATTQSYESADIKVSSSFDEARVENPNPCGSPGSHVELPVDFFSDDLVTPRYGDSVKAVLNLFARYRYGVWEEHGEIGNTQFPYFHIKPSLDPQWTFTGCSANLEGKILTRQGQESVDCDTFTEKGPGDNCRFVPAEKNVVNSSLGFLPWANGVTEFCDETTHNHDAPNRQNLFCGHRSIWEVIRDSEDHYQTVGKPLDDLPPLNFRVVTTSDKPLLYILLDRGRTSTSTEVLDEIVQSLQSFVNTTFLPQDIVAAVGTYPQISTGRSHFYVNEEWSTIQNGSIDFSNVVRRTLEHYDGPVVRDFGLAIQEVVEKIKVRNHAAGAIVLVVKRGATQNGFEHSTYFGDVLSSIQGQNLRLYAIEIQQNPKTPYVNLKGLVTLTNGIHCTVNATTGIRQLLDPCLDGIRQQLSTALEPESTQKWTVFKGFVPLGLGNEVGIPILDENVRSLTLCLTTKKHIPEGEIVIRQVEGTPQEDFTSIRRDEWNEVADLSKRIVYIVKIVNPPKDSKWDVLVKNCTSVIYDDCVSYLVATVESDDITIPSSSLDIRVETSAENNYLDFDRGGSKIAPLSIFAQIERNGQRILNLDGVFAKVIFNNLRQVTIPLQDDGSGLPDVSTDGIYSAIFTPPQNGIYKVSVSVSQQTALRSEIVNLLGSLIPVDQSQFGCSNISSNARCNSAVVPGYLARTESMLGTLLVDNSITFSPRPIRILDFSVTTLPGKRLRFGFTSPQILGIDGAKADWVKIYMGSSVNQFVGGTDNVQLILQAVGGIPGEFVEYEHNNMETQEVGFFAVESDFRTQKAGPSNVVGTVVNEEGVPPIPSPTTTTPAPPTPPLTTTQNPPQPTTTRVPDVNTTSTVTPRTPTTTKRSVSGGCTFTLSRWTALVPILIVIAFQ